MREDLIYDQVKKSIEYYNELHNHPKAFLESKKTKDTFGREYILFKITVNNVVIFFKDYILSENVDESKAKNLAATDILNYLIHTRLPIWIESLNHKP